MSDRLADSELDARLARVEAELAAPKPPLESRVAVLESRVDALKPKTKDLWEKAQSLSGIVAAIVTGAVGLYLTGVVNRGFEERKLETANVEKMRDLIGQLNKDRIEEKDAEAIGLTLGAFGEFAVPSLVAALGTNTTSRAAGARTGLLAASLNDKPAVCKALVGVLSNRSQLYTVLMHKRAVELLGKLDCGRAGEDALRAYLELVNAAMQPGGLPRYAATLDPALPVGPDEVAGMQRDLCATPPLRAACAAGPR
ncbi:MAG TPA: hypothetical protein PLE54_07760 [Burkholderiaceae bacterium]|nr:hypothetical protein [Burkholderiaceae bacterium]